MRICSCSETSMTQGKQFNLRHCVYHNHLLNLSIYYRFLSKIDEEGTEDRVSN